MKQKETHRQRAEMCGSSSWAEVWGRDGEGVWG